MTSFSKGHSHPESDPAADGSAASSPSGSRGAAPDSGAPDSTAPDPEAAFLQRDHGSELPRLGRAKLVEARLERLPGSRLQVTVSLERRDHVCRKEVLGVGDEVMALRLAAEATISALECITGYPGYFVLVGIKTIHAFDADVVLVCVRTATARSRSLMGSVPATGDLTRGVAMAVLHATNRLVETLVPPENMEVP